MVRDTNTDQETLLSCFEQIFFRFLQFIWSDTLYGYLQSSLLSISLALSKSLTRNREQALKMPLNSGSHRCLKTWRGQYASWFASLCFSYIICCDQMGFISCTFVVLYSSVFVCLLLYVVGLYLFVLLLSACLPVFSCS